MNIDSALSVAGGGLAAVNVQLGLISQNIANASTPGYAVEKATLQSLTAGGVGMGVMTGPATRASDDALQGALLEQNGVAAGLAARQSALAGIDAVQGTPGAGDDLGSLLGKLQDAFSSLAGAPADTTQQSAVVAAAQTLAQGVNTLGAAIGNARQAAQDTIVADVAAANATLATIGSLSDQIVALKSRGQSTADLEGQRDSAIQSLSSLLDIKVLRQRTAMCYSAPATASYCQSTAQRIPSGPVLPHSDRTRIRLAVAFRRSRWAVAM
jgi:flagellar hook-associated protein 1 FlgK